MDDYKPCVVAGTLVQETRIAPLLLPACCKRWWVPVAKSISVQYVKDDMLLQSWVQFVALASLKDFATPLAISDNSVNDSAPLLSLDVSGQKA